MSKVLIFSDIHIHPHKKSSQRLNDCLEVLNWVFKVAKEKNIEKIIFLGDLFHERQKIDVYTYQKVFEIFEKHTNENLDVYLLLGNHDLWFSNKWDVSSVFPLKNLKGVKVIGNPCEIDIYNKKVGFLPYTKNVLKELESIKESEILCAHIAINGAILNTVNDITSDFIEHDGDMEIVDESNFKIWKRVFLGHYHAHQNISENIEYIGSPLELSFGESLQKKHVLIYDFEKDEKEYVINDFSPKHFILNKDELKDKDINKNFFKILVSNEIDEIELREELSSKNIGSLEVKYKQKNEEDEIEEFIDAKDILNKKDEIIERYVKEKLFNNLDKDKLIKIGNEIFNRKTIEEKVSE